MSARVLVIGGPTRAATALIRELQMRGDTCDLIGRGSRADALLLTRSARRFIRVSRQEAPDLESLGEAILGVAAGGDYDVVIPTGDWETWLVVHHGERLQGRVGTLVPDPESYEVANDKGSVMARAAAAGIGTPEVWDWPDAPDLESLPETLRYPVVVKARSGSGVHRGLRYAADPAGLRAAYLEIAATEAVLPTEQFSRPLIMEFVPGFVHDVGLVARNGQVQNLITTMRLLTIPVEGGVTGISVSTDEPVLADATCRLIRSLRFTGPADVEFKHDPRDGRFKLLEVNPRFWGNLEPDLAAGMDFATQVRDLALGRDIARDKSYEVGLRGVIPARAVPAAIQQARVHGLTSLRDRRSYHRTTMGISLSDPGPALKELKATVWSTAHELRVQAGGLGRIGKEPVTGALPKDLVNRLDRAGATD